MDERHVFLAFLGTNPYSWVEAYQPLEGEVETGRQRYTQVARVKAITEMLGHQNKQLDRVVVFVTSDACKKNWKSDGMPLPKDEGDRDAVTGKGCWTGLLESIALSESGVTPMPDIECEPIPEGRTSDELWKIFNAVQEQIEPGDIVYVDVTHGFRTLPLLMILALDYVVRAKGATVAQITYGAFEAEDRNSHVARPTWDFLPFFGIRDWTAALAQLRQRGDLELFGEHARQRASEASKSAFREAAASVDEGSSKKDRESAFRAARQVERETVQPELRRVAEALHELGDCTERARLHALPNTAYKALRAIEAALALEKEPPDFAPLKPVLAAVKSDLEPMASADSPGSEDAIRAQLHAARWCIRYGRHHQGYTLLRESLVDLCCLALPDGIGRTGADRLVSALHHARRYGLQATRRIGWNEAMHQVFDHLVASEWGEALNSVLNRVVSHRNALNHAHTSNSVATDTLVRDGERLVEQAIGLMPVPKYAVEAPGVPRLFNVTNHQLTADQIEDARQRWDIVDVVDLDEELKAVWANIEVGSAASLIFDRLWQRSTHADVIVVQGEYGATFTLVSMLRTAGRRVVYASTAREVTECQEPDGSVTTVHRFRHRGFLEYGDSCRTVPG
jgi:CRISPR-associated DxTHG motif protein